MILDKRNTRGMLQDVIVIKEEQGYIVDGLQERLKEEDMDIPQLMEFAHSLNNLERRADWSYEEPEDWEDIQASMHPERSNDFTGAVPADMEGRVRTAFLASVAGCILGKPIENRSATYHDIRAALEASGEWPLQDYFTTKAMEHYEYRHRSWPTTCKDNIEYVEVDDDIDYKVLNLVLLENHGPQFSKEEVGILWFRNFQIFTVYAAERTWLLKTALRISPLMNWHVNASADDLGHVLNPYEERCGPSTHVDPFGYCYPGRPEWAAYLAWKDSSRTNRLSGVYSAMYTAALISLAPCIQDRMELIRTALNYVPQNSRFHERTAACIEQIAEASDWIDGFTRIEKLFGQYGFCHIYQEIGDVLNALVFAKSTEEVICIQAMQGLDTDSWTATAGAIAGVYFGADSLDEDKWISIFNDKLYTTLGLFHEQSLEAVAQRMAKLPGNFSNTNPFETQDSIAEPARGTL